MKIGFTYDLRQDYLALVYGEEETGEFDRIDAIEAIEGTMQDLGYEIDRIGNIWSLTQRLAAGDPWDLVFTIAEGLHGVAGEAQVPALLQAYDIPCTFSDALVLALTLHKGMTKRVLRDLGVPTPDFVEIHSPADIAEVALPYRLFAKPIAEATGKVVTPASKLTKLRELQTVCERLLKTYRQPVLVETFLPGREFTVGIVGSGAQAKSVGVVEVVVKGNAEQHACSLVNNERCEEFVGYLPVNADMAQEAAEIALAAWRGLECRDAGRIDLRADADGLPDLMEVNPLAGIHPEHSDLPIICTLHGIDYQEPFEMILASALTRVDSQRSAEHLTRPQLVF